MDYFKNYSTPYYSTGGEVATSTIILKQGKKDLQALSHPIEPYLRTLGNLIVLKWELGLPTKLEDKEIHLLKDYTVAEQGITLTVEQAKILVWIGFVLFV